MSFQFSLFHLLLRFNFLVLLDATSRSTIWAKNCINNLKCNHRCANETLDWWISRQGTVSRLLGPCWNAAHALLLGVAVAGRKSWTRWWWATRDREEKHKVHFLAAPCFPATLVRVRKSFLNVLHLEGKKGKRRQCKVINCHSFRSHLY